MISIGFFLCMHIAWMAQDLKPPRRCFTGKDEYVVDHVVDSGTVILDRKGSKLKVVLIGVMAHALSDHRLEARKFLVNLLKGERVYVEYDSSPRDHDEFGRTRAYLFRTPDGLFVNAELVRQGYCRVGSKNMFRYFRLFKSYEEKARKVKKGMWHEDQKSSHTPRAR